MTIEIARPRRQSLRNVLIAMQMSENISGFWWWHLERIFRLVSRLNERERRRQNILCVSMYHKKWFKVSLLVYTSSVSFSSLLGNVFGWGLLEYYVSDRVKKKILRRIDGESIDQFGVNKVHVFNKLKNVQRHWFLFIFYFFRIRVQMTIKNTFETSTIVYTFETNTAALKPLVQISRIDLQQMPAHTRKIGWKTEKKKKGK